MTMIERIERRAIRERVADVVSKLHQLDNLLMDVCESLPLPTDASEMWELRIPMSFSANLYGAVEAVRSDCIQDAVATLLRAARHNDASLRSEFLQEHGKHLKSFLENAVYPSSIKHTNPGGYSGRKEPPRC